MSSQTHLTAMEKVQSDLNIYVSGRPALAWRSEEGFPEGVTFGWSHETERHPWDGKRIPKPTSTSEAGLQNRSDIAINRNGKLPVTREDPGPSTGGGKGIQVNLSYSLGGKMSHD